MEKVLWEVVITEGRSLKRGSTVPAGCCCFCLGLLVVVPGWGGGGRGGGGGTVNRSYRFVQHFTLMCIS